MELPQCKFGKGLRETVKISKGIIFTHMHIHQEKMISFTIHYSNILFKHQRVPGFSKEFRDTVKDFAEKYFMKETKENIFAKVCFFEHHPKINKELLDGAISETMLSRHDFSNDILSPVEVISFLLYVQ